MARASNLAVAFGAALALGACAGEGGQYPTSPDAPAFQTGNIGPACSLTDLRKATQALFGSNSAEADIAKQFTSRNQNQAAVTPFAYNLFAAIAAERNALAEDWTAQNTADAVNLTIQTIACSDVVYTDPDLSGTANLSDAIAAFTAALSGSGIYEVRGGGVEGNLVAHDAQSGLKPPTTFGAWLGTGGRALIIGYEIDAFLGETWAEFSYDYSMVRPNNSAALTGLATISYCTDFNGAPPAALRIQHLPAAENGLIIQSTSTHVFGVDCQLIAAASDRMPMSLAARALRVLVDAVKPAPLHALVGTSGPVSGLIKSFSPTQVVWPETINLEFTTQPTGAPAFTAIPVVVEVTGDNGVPWEHVLVKLTAFQNNGAKLAPCGDTATTDSEGVATFTSFKINKPGGAFLTATTVEPGVDPDIAGGYASSAESDHFIVGPGSGSCP